MIDSTVQHSSERLLAEMYRKYHRLVQLSEQLDLQATDSPAHACAVMVPVKIAQAIETLDQAIARAEGELSEASALARQQTGERPRISA